MMIVLENQLKMSWNLKESFEWAPCICFILWKLCPGKLFGRYGFIFILIFVNVIFCFSLYVFWIRSFFCRCGNTPGLLFLYLFYVNFQVFYIKCLKSPFGICWEVMWKRWGSNSGYCGGTYLGLPLCHVGLWYHCR